MNDSDFETRDPVARCYECDGPAVYDGNFCSRFCKQLSKIGLDNNG